MGDEVTNPSTERCQAALTPPSNTDESTFRPTRQDRCLTSGPVNDNVFLSPILRRWFRDPLRLDPPYHPLGQFSQPFELPDPSSISAPRVHGHHHDCEAFGDVGNIVAVQRKIFRERGNVIHR